MTGNHDAGRGRLLAVGLAAVLLCSLGATGAVLGAGDATISVGDADVGVDGSGTATVSLTAAPNGLSGFNITLSVSGDAAAISSASIDDQFDLTDTGVSEDGSQVWIKAVDTKENVQSGAESVQLATVTLSGQSAGETELSVASVEMDDDSGNAIEPATEAGSLTVGSGASGESGDSGSGGSGDSGGPSMVLIGGGLAAVVVLGAVAFFVMKD